MNNIIPNNKQYLKYFLCLSFIYCCIFFYCVSCSGMTKKQISTHWEFSDGLRDGNSVYFLTEYALYQSGKVIIPLYFRVNDKYHFDNAYLYSYDSGKKNLTRLAVVKPSAPGVGRSKISYARFVKHDREIYMSYKSGWDKQKKQFKNEIFKFNIQNNSLTEIPNADREEIYRKYFADDRSPAAKNPTFISSSEIYSLVKEIPLKEWQFPSPLDYTSLSNSALETILIENTGDKYFLQAIFAKLKTEYSIAELNNIITKIEKRLKSLDSYNQKVYMPYLEECSTKIKMAAKFEKAGGTEKVPQVIVAAFQDNNQEIAKLIRDINAADEDGLTALMAAAYYDKKETAMFLINNGANINAKDKNGCTPLMYAVFGKAGNTLSLFFEKGADRKIEANSGSIAWMFVANTSLRGKFLELEEKYSPKKK